MERDDDRDRKVSRDPASFNDAKRSPSNPLRVGVRIHDAERELKETRSIMTSGVLLKGDSCADIMARIDKDAEIIQDVRGMRREVWAGATPDQRIRTLNELEQRLAASQGRAPHPVYLVRGRSTAMSQADLHMTGLERELRCPTPLRFEPQVRNQTVTPSEAHALGLLAGSRIRVDEAFVAPRWGSSDVRDLAEPIFKACRYAYQRAVVLNPDRHPEVSSHALQLLQAGYVDEVRLPLHRQRYDNQMLVFAWCYAEDMRRRVYGRSEWESPS